MWLHTEFSSILITKALQALQQNLQGAIACRCRFASGERPEVLYLLEDLKLVSLVWTHPGAWHRGSAASPLRIVSPGHQSSACCDIFQPPCMQTSQLCKVNKLVT